MATDDADVSVQIDSVMSYLKTRVKDGVPTGVMRASTYAAGQIAEHLGPGTLARSFKALPIELRRDSVSSWAASRGAAQKYAGIQDQGGTIRPRVMKNLAVPLRLAKTAKGKWPRHFGMGELKLVPRKGRAPLLVRELSGKTIVARRGKNRIYKTWVKAIQPLFVLLKSVQIKPKYYLAAVRGRPDFQARCRELIDKAIADASKKGSRKRRHKGK